MLQIIGPKVLRTRAASTKMTVTVNQWPWWLQLQGEGLLQYSITDTNFYYCLAEGSLDRNKITEVKKTTTEFLRSFLL